MRATCFAALLAMLAGCAQTRSYQISMRNNAAEAITIGLTKIGGPPERSWASPEEAAINGAEPSARMWAAVPPGRSANTGPITGQFHPDAQAILRVYRGSLTLPQILAISRGEPDRIDIPLHPGLNRFTVSERDGKLLATRQEGGGSQTYEP